MKKEIKEAFYIGIKWSFFLGIVYPLVMTLVAQMFMYHEANGSQIIIDKQVKGSSLIGQSFQEARYFWPRPSACNYSVLDSAGSNLALTSSTLYQQVAARKKQFSNLNVPAHLLYASASGIDPHVPLSAVLFQYERVVKARSFSIQEKYVLLERIHELEQRSLFSADSEAYINVLELNLALDRIRL